MRYSAPPVAGSAHTKPPPVSVRHLRTGRSRGRRRLVSSNVGQNYPYTSETEAERAAVIARLVAEREGLAATLAAESTPLDPQERWWVWKCPTTGCPGLLRAAGYAAEKHAVFVVCDGTCAKTFLR
jgi:hypothetical protein